MRRFILASAVVIAGTLAALAPGSAVTARTYATNFTATENPISEGGNWLNGAAVGLDWTNMRSTPGKAYGTQPGNSANPYDDSAAILAGAWGNDQSASATIFVSVTPGTCCTEVELRLRSTMTAHNSSGYEFNCSMTPANPYMEIVRWLGPKGSFSYVTRRGDVGCRNGDVLGASAVGSTLTLSRNGTVMLTATDTMFLSGAPGMGHFIHNQTGINANFGFTNFSASDAGAPVPTPTRTLVPSATSTAAPPTDTPIPATLTPSPTTSALPSVTPTLTATPLPSDTVVTCRVSVEINGTPGPYRPC